MATSATTGTPAEQAAKAARESRVVTPSKAAILKHPIHPMLIPFPIAFLTGALVTDVVAVAGGSDFWSDASVWLVGAGLVTGALAAVFGLVDFLAIEKVRASRVGWVHSLGNAAVLALAAVNLVIRLDDPASAVSPWGITLSALTAALLGVTGWAGGDLSYRHGIGVEPHEATRASH